MPMKQIAAEATSVSVPLPADLLQLSISGRSCPTGRGCRRSPPDRRSSQAPTPPWIPITPRSVLPALLPTPTRTGRLCITSQSRSRETSTPPSICSTPPLSRDVLTAAAPSCRGFSRPPTPLPAEPYPPPSPALEAGEQHSR
jgi:hypothetical protein